MTTAPVTGSPVAASVTLPDTECGCAASAARKGHSARKTTEFSVCTISYLYPEQLFDAAKLPGARYESVTAALQKIEMSTGNEADGKSAAIRRAFAIFAGTEMPCTRYITASLPAGDYLRSYCDARRIEEYCRACGNYGRIWGCPPFDTDPLERLAGYGHIRIIGAVVTLDAKERHRPADVSKRPQPPMPS